MTRAQKEQIIAILNIYGGCHNREYETNPLVSAMAAMPTEG